MRVSYERDAALMRVAKGSNQPEMQRVPVATTVGRRAWAWLALLLAAFALRLYRLEAQSLWFDEGVTLRLATSTLSQIMSDRAANIHPPLYFFLMKGWVGLFGVHVFADRYASVLMSLMLIPLTFVVARRWLGPGTARKATLLVAFAPLFIVYAQELRVYALLPLVSLLLLYQTWRLLHRQRATSRDWIWYGLLAWLGLHLHYVVAFLVAYVALWSLVGLWCRGRRGALRAWLLTHLLVAFFSLPWLSAVLSNWQQVQRELTAGYQMAEAAPLPFVAEQIWLFHWTGLAGAVGQAPLRWLGRALAVLLLVLLVLRRPAMRRQSLALLAHWFLPLAAAFILWSVRASAHPRYVTLFSTPLFLLAARLVTPERGARHSLWRLIPAVSGGLLMLLLAGLALQAYFFHPTMGKKDDMRGVARYLQQTATACDLILAPYRDWSLAYEYDGAAPLVMPLLQERGALWADLQQRTTAVDTVYLVRHEVGSRDWQELLPYALERAGTLRQVQHFDGLMVYGYQLQRPVTAPSLEARTARFGPLVLTGAAVEPQAEANSAVAVALSWQHTAPDAQNYHVALTLRDVDGWPIQQVDRPLVGPDGQGTAGWPAGRPITTTHLLPLPPGTPPLTYTVTAELYALNDAGVQPLPLSESGETGASQLALGTTILTAGGGGSAYDVQAQPPAWEEPAQMAPGLQLVAAAADREAVAPGQSLFVRLRWRSASSGLPDLRPQLELWRDDERLALAGEAPVLDRYPTSAWREGELVAEHRRLVVPPTAEGGPARLVMALGDRRVTLGEVAVDAVARQFEEPAAVYEAEARFGDLARLVGFDLSQTSFEAGQTITLTLYWQSLATGVEPPYTVFTHMLAEDGHIVTQDDAPPGKGRRPTNGWVAGEYVVDVHHLSLEAPDYSGPVRFAVGLYNPQNGERLRLPDGSDSFVLPVQATLEAEE